MLQRIVVFVVGFAMAADLAYPPWYIETRLRASALQRTRDRRGCVYRTCVFNPPADRIDEMFENAQMRSMVNKGWRTSLEEIDEVLREHDAFGEERTAEKEKKNEWMREVSKLAPLSRIDFQAFDATEENRKLLLNAFDQWEDANRRERAFVEHDRLGVELVSLGCMGGALFVLFGARKRQA